MIPPFDLRGVLPPFLGADAVTPNRSPYLCSMLEVVERFAGSGERRLILRGLLDYRALLYANGFVSGVQSIDGSFVENVETIRGVPPADVDVFSWLDLPVMNTSGSTLDPTGETIWLEEVINSPKNKARFHVDTYALLLSELSFSDAFQQVNYWTSLFSHQLRTQAWKGFLTVDLNEANDGVALQRLVELEAAYA